MLRRLPKYLDQGAEQVSRRSFWPSMWSFAVVGHAIAFSMAYSIGFLLRFDFQIPDALLGTFWQDLPWVVAAQLLVFAAARQLRSWWGHVTFADLISLVAAASTSLVCLASINQLGLFPLFIPRVVLLIDFAATILFVGALRSTWRGVEEYGLPLWQRRSYQRALLVGASHADKIRVLRLQSHPHMPLRIRGFVDETPCRRGERIGGVPVLGALNELIDIARERRATDIVVIAGSVAGRTLNYLCSQCEAANLNLRIIPPLTELAKGRKELPVQPLNVESLLRREPIELDESLVCELVENAVVLVTGAGGSIGSEICRQLLRFHPRSLVLVDRSEPSLFQIDLELRELHSRTSIEPCLGDVTDAPRMRQILLRCKPSLVFHVAAHKHVPLLESQPGEAVKNNFFGTARLADLADELGVEGFVYISTDKAVNASSIMGLTKRLAEDYVHAMATHSATRFVAVRFGNVLGSAGSVVPLFYGQIRKGGPIRVTHPQMQRFFMTIPEAARLVLQAASLGKGGEVFVLDMGEPVRIVDLAQDMIRMAGLPPGAVEIEFVGPRPGEKLQEELYFSDERPLSTRHSKLISATPRPVSLAAMQQCLADLEPLVNGDEQRLIEKLRQWVPEYAPPASIHGRAPATESESEAMMTSERAAILGGID